jgi:DNA mismatch repair protein MutL
MTRIRVLPDTLVNQIAAGEVVERPASVVKELVENALDAGATRIEVTISEGGIRSIVVTDDGAGMSPEDAALAFQRHATSKIRTATDLAAVGTLGFRGEALPSIASVARVRMLTRPPQASRGTELLGEGRGIEKLQETGCPSGTRVEIAELFGRVPARRKFLKSANTEAGHIVRWLERIALVRPDVRFELIRDGRPSLLLPPTANPRERVIAVLPPSVGDRLVPVEGEIPSARLTGFASPTDVMRGTTDGIHLFVNARPVRDRLLLFAVREAYRDALPPGKHPVVALFLQVDPDEVDVNVHPAKAEVRFRDPAAIQQLVRRSLRAALGIRVAPPGARHAYPARPTDASAWRIADAATRADDGRAQPGLPLARTSYLDADVSVASPDPRLRALPVDTRPLDPHDDADFRFAELRYLGQLLGCYLLLERRGQLVLLDQHAAHERVLFEHLWRALREDALERQPLLVPHWVELERSAGDALAEAAERLERAGFEIEPGEPTARGRARVCLRSVPALLADRRLDAAALLEQTAAVLRDPAASETRDGIDGLLHHIAATAACHAATRKGDRLEPREVQALLAQLDETVWFANCPHGRPFVAALDEAELERLFLRR